MKISYKYCYKGCTIFALLICVFTGLFHARLLSCHRSARNSTYIGWDFTLLICCYEILCIFSILLGSILLLLLFLRGCSHIQIGGSGGRHVDFILRSENEGFVRNNHGRRCVYRAPYRKDQGLRGS